MKFNHKRIFDLIISTVSIIVMSPFFYIIAIGIKATIGSPILFSQTRPGQNGVHFQLRKFRTMTGLRDPHGIKLEDGERLTRFGRILRSTSLDELPELFNIINGDMSLVGPRPLLMQYLERYTQEQARRHDVKPGLTGWAQVNGRNAISWEEKFKLDVWYVDNRTFWLDLKIIAMTIKKVFLREGVSHAGEATMSEFMGYLKNE